MDKFRLFEELGLHPNIFGIPTGQQVDDLYRRAGKLRVDSFIDEENVVKINSRIDGLRAVVDRNMKQMWDSEIFIDPLLRKYKATWVDDVYITLSPNLHCCLFYPDLHPFLDGQILMRNGNSPECIKYKDLRLVAGYKAPLISFDTEDMKNEIKRIKIKEAHLVKAIQDHTKYFINPSIFDRYLTETIEFRNSPAAKIFSYARNLVIYIGNGQFRVVNTKLEQWIWEQYVKAYGNSTTPYVLNSLLYNDNPDQGTCSIYVPMTNTNQELYKFINRFQTTDTMSLFVQDQFSMYNEIQ